MQSRMDSIMEVVTGTIIGLVISTIANHFLFVTVLGIGLTLATNLGIGVFFTLISIGRQYVIRRAFNGKTPWQSLKSWWAYRRLIRQWERMNLV